MSTVLHAHEGDTLVLEDEFDELYDMTREDPLGVRTDVLHILRKHGKDLEPYYLAYAYEILADTYYMTSSYDSAINYLVEARGIMEVMDDSVSLAYNAVYLGDIYREMGMYDEATRYYLRSRQYFRSLKDEYGIGQLNYALSLLYAESHEFNKALRAAHSSLRFTLNNEDSSYVAATLTQLADVHYELGNLDSALYYTDLSFRINRMFETGIIERQYAHISRAYVDIELGNFSNARAHMDSALGISNDLSDQYARVMVYIAEARLAAREGRVQDINKWVSLARSTSVEYSITSSIKYLIENQIEIAIEMGDYEKAYYLADTLESYKAALVEENLDLMQMEDELTRARARADELVAERQREQFSQQWNITVALGSLILALIAGIAWFLQYRTNKRVKRLNSDLASRNKLISEQNSKLDEQTKVLSLNQKLLTKSNADKDKLLALISHDLRSPIAQTKSIADLVVAGAIDEKELITFFEKVSQSADKSLENLTEVLVWAKGQMGNGGEHSRDVVDVKSAVQNAYSIVQDSFDKKGLDFILDAEEDARIICDEGHFGVIARNLLSNAAKFSFENDEVIGRISQNDAWVTLSVKDNGVGMSEEVQHKIFKEGRVHTSRGTKQESGTGTGLQLLREYVQANSGELNYHSIEGKGTSISVSFRRAYR